ncbi:MULTISPECIES: UDP-2,3-diacylglucosamine diphosphatase [Gammaproteobacteria]|uniref:UDP-2,3-diacylglucosamine diphosphatase n=1 Tax=Gammaproteobacteria TaxID=1236 RepID=UPI000DD0C805|nr:MULTISPECIES: UDP-2,3-diacylglucosamine diphosphatase [Gammaproteobacteria]RTE86558.1 UDP-2,3-diacylglucosamine diphosphatase [Aliidiomarina sp. B3213]TCZ90887.1 UDP-2,3-diacylglucosamine diphosphatase [Lysobacter sp. N42]
MKHQTAPVVARTLFISDVHLGSKDCKADFLLHLLQSVKAEKIYIVGDLVDFWAMKKQMFWPAKHHEIIQSLLAKAQSGVEVIYIPGNHDGAMRKYRHPNVASIRIQRKAIHTTAAGKRLLVLHGDEFDEQVYLGRWLHFIGDKLYYFLLALNRHVNRMRKWTGRYYWSLSSYVKGQFAKAELAITRFREAAIQEAKKRGLDGIVCGHIHQPDLRMENGIIYANDGDWVEHCSALVESETGELELMYWTDAEIASASTSAFPDKNVVLTEPEKRPQAA